MFCSSCGHELGINANFCVNCGSSKKIFNLSVSYFVELPASVVLNNEVF